MQSLSKSDEQQLLDGVKMAVSLVDDQGLSPNAALQKVLRERHAAEQHTPPILV